MFRFQYKYALLSLFFFLVEVIIERFFHGGFIRNVFGDYLVVFLIYCFVLSFFKWKKLYVAIGGIGIGLPHRNSSIYKRSTTTKNQKKPSFAYCIRLFL